MLTLLVSIVASSLLAQSPDSIFVSGFVVDAAGNPLADVDVVLPALRPADGSLPTLAHTTTDGKGAFRLEIARQRFEDIPIVPFLWAYSHGRSVAVGRAVITRSGAPPPPVRLTLAQPLPRALTILGPDDRPLAGVRVAPVLYAFDGVAAFQTPDDRLERLTIVSGADGVVVLPYQPERIDPLTVRVTAPGIAPHILPVADRPGRDRITLKLGRPAQLAGTVYGESGQPASNVPIEVWVENSYHRPSVPRDAPNTKLAPSLVHFDTGAVHTRADGTFLTPPQLLTGLSYRIIIRADDSPMVTSDWVVATTELTTAPLLRLGQHRKLMGLVNDRQGKPVAGAHVFHPSGEPSTTTDAQGRFALEGVLPEKTYLLVKAAGFRLQGWPAIPARQPAERKLVLVRTSEPPDRTMVPQPPAISVEEARDLARRLLEPTLQAALANGGDNPKWHCLSLASKLDPHRVLELVENHPFGNPTADSTIRQRVAAELLATDPKEAESIINAITSPELHAYAYVWLADALPAGERNRRREFLDLATVQARVPAGGGFDPQSRLNELARVAGSWLNFGDVEKARPLIREGLELVAVLPVIERYNTNFLPTAARIEPERVLSFIREFSNARRRLCYSAVAESLAHEHPADAERVFELIDDSSESRGEVRAEIALRLCWRLAKTDPERARRIIAGLKLPGERACGWALLALGLLERDQRAARSALAESIREIDRLLDSAGTSKSEGSRIPVANIPAASILPIVEKVAPELLDEVFWRAVALMPKDDTARQRGVISWRPAEAAIFLARYDRQVAEVFVTQAMASVPASRRVVYSPLLIRAKAAVDPQGAVALMQAVPAGGLDPQVPADRLMNQARDAMIAFLTEASDDHWKFVWEQSGIPLRGR